MNTCKRYRYDKSGLFALTISVKNASIALSAAPEDEIYKN